MEIGIWLERKLVILLGKYLTAGRGVVRPGSVQIRSVRRGRWHDEKYQQRHRIEGSHETLLLMANRLREPFDCTAQPCAWLVVSPLNNMACDELACPSLI
jgi:hypothetical protein